MIEDCHRRFRDDALVEDLIALLEKHVRACLVDWAAFPIDNVCTYCCMLVRETRELPLLLQHVNHSTATEYMAWQHPGNPYFLAFFAFRNGQCNTTCQPTWPILLARHQQHATNKAFLVLHKPLT